MVNVEREKEGGDQFLKINLGIVDSVAHHHHAAVECYIAAEVPTVCLLFPASAQWRSGGGGAVAEFPCAQSATIPRVRHLPRCSV